MAWFRKEKKPRQPRTERLEIPPDTWEKCEACGHTDIRAKFLRNHNVCPECDYHRRLRAWDYATMLLDESTIGEVGGELRSVDPLGFPEYPGRLKRALANAGDSDAILTVTGLMEGLPVTQSPNSHRQKTKRRPVPYRIQPRQRFRIESERGRPAFQRDLRPLGLPLQLIGERCELLRSRNSFSWWQSAE